MVTLRVNLEATGKVLTKSQSPVIQRMAGAIVLELVQKGESRLDEVLRPRPAGVYLSVAEAQPNKASTGHFRRSVHARHTGVNSAIESNVIYGAWLEGDSARNATSRFKGYSSFRKTGQWLQQQANPIMQTHVNRFVRSIS